MDWPVQCQRCGCHTVVLSPLSGKNCRRSPDSYGSRLCPDRGQPTHLYRFSDSGLQLTMPCLGFKLVGVLLLKKAAPVQVGPWKVVTVTLKEVISRRP